MPWQKAPVELVAVLDTALASFHNCQRKVMFGYPAYFVNDHMFTGLHEDRVILRLSQNDRETLVSAFPDARQFEPMPGRPMREYVVLPACLYLDARQFEEWLNRSYQHASPLQPKEPRRRPKQTK